MKIVVFGAGSIGAFVGGCLLASGAQVQLVGRPSMRQRIEQHGLRLSDLNGWSAEFPASSVPYAESPEVLTKADLVIVAVKSSGTKAAATEVARHAPSSAMVVSFQNGIGNAAALRDALPGRVVLGGMVPFNVVQLSEGRLHRGTAGELMVEAHEGWSSWLATFAAARLPLEQRSDFVAVQWGKLLLNLNNAVNALSGVPLKAQLSDHRYRHVLAQLMDEALAAFQAAELTPAQVSGVPPGKLPALMRLPDADFGQVASTMLAIDPQARSSMWEDLEAGRLTEIDELNGAVVRLAREHGLSAPANEAICALVHAAERGGDRQMQGRALLRAVGLQAGT
ncbi:2-dehydropantoate 2-reductase [Variovorax ginsengisoli]|uniref:2-dehydropantoate 2-reductase n=1 Tax=Variovorax ginsengisoli TaxID=363844 RepID=A0ABT8SDV4_9BURK|nr:2-dehydropantoate 2-reductase [Variovorax ginsengisoli]MDN8617413.1 2-dehydropantoate 2-reductase [Variovorax ginsengisoli]MDO1536583.1 2-dehydropantoate 2-reductase [Variovorax ginsengisoli]